MENAVELLERAKKCPVIQSQQIACESEEEDEKIALA